MQNEEYLLKLIFSNQMCFCGIFGALGGIVHALDLRTDLTLGVLVKNFIISFMTGILLFFITYDLTNFTPSVRIASAAFSGFYGSTLFRLLARFYMRTPFSPSYLPNVLDDDAPKIRKQGGKDNNNQQTSAEENNHGRIE